MTTSQIMSRSEKISRGDMAYACARGRHQAHHFLLKMLKESGLTQRALAERAGIDAAALSRALTKPNNYEIETISKIAYAACGAYVDVLRLVAPDPAQKSQDSRLNLIFIPSSDLDTDTANKNGISGAGGYASVRTGNNSIRVAS